MSATEVPTTTTTESEVGITTLEEEIAEFMLEEEEDK